MLFSLFHLIIVFLFDSWPFCTLFQDSFKCLSNFFLCQQWSLIPHLFQMPFATSPLAEGQTDNMIFLFHFTIARRMIDYCLHTCIIGRNASRVKRTNQYSRTHCHLLLLHYHSFSCLQHISSYCIS